MLYTFVHVYVWIYAYVYAERNFMWLYISKPFSSIYLTRCRFIAIKEGKQANKPSVPFKV